MRDRDIRSALHDQLARRYRDDPETLVLDELGVLRGSCRIDVAVINGTLHGFEIKSEEDTLARLPAQADAYSSVFDEVTIVGSERHLGAVEALVPDWWSIVVAVRATRTRITLEQVRDGEPNPSPDAHAIAQLLWRDETLTALEGLGLARGLRSKPRAVLAYALADAMPVADLGEFVRRQLRGRTDWRAAS
jgi:hypothetical protein